MQQSDIDEAIVNVIKMFLRGDGNFNEFDRSDVQMHAGRALAEKFKFNVDQGYFAVRDRLGIQAESKLKGRLAEKAARDAEREAERRAELRAENHFAGFDRE